MGKVDLVRATHLFSPKPARAEGGFLLPLAAVTSLVLLLGSLSMVQFSLVGRERLASEQELRISEDQVVSAAHDLVSRLAQQHPCLLPLRRPNWSGTDCARTADLNQLASGSLLEGQWQVLRWEPSLRSPQQGEQSVVEFDLDWRPVKGQGRVAQFALGLSAEPQKVVQLRLLGWIGRV